MNKTKKYVTIAAVLLCVCAAVYLNWSYNNNNSEGKTGTEVSNTGTESGGTDASASTASDYFASARLTRQQSRDEALNLLQTAAASKEASQETIDSATSAIAAMANYSMMETEIENILLAKNFSECVAFISADGVTLAVPAPQTGLAAEDVAKITDAVISETKFTATQIKIIEVKDNSGAVTDTATGSADTAKSSADASIAGAAASPDSLTSGNSDAQTGKTDTQSSQTTQIAGDKLE
jgi:stage III sporulation protein AH